MANKYIEIKEGLSILKENIESIEMISEDGIQDNGSRIIMSSGANHDTTFPYLTILQLLEIPEPEEREHSFSTGLEEKFDAVLDKHTYHSG